MACKPVSALATGQIAVICSPKAIARGKQHKTWPEPLGRLRSIALPMLTERFAAANLTDEYSARARGSGFTSKPNRKERKTKANRTVESSRNNRATRLARWFQDRRRSREKPRLVFKQCSR